MSAFPRSPRPGPARPEISRADYNRFDDAVYVPNGDDPDWPKVEAYLDGGTAPQFTYHRFWAQADIALAMAAYAQLLEPGSGSQ
jgi:hypothetical protein